MPRHTLQCRCCNTKHPLITRAEVASVEEVPDSTPKRATVRLVTGQTFTMTGDETVANLLHFFSLKPSETDLAFVGPRSLKR